MGTVVEDAEVAATEAVAVMVVVVVATQTVAARGMLYYSWTPR